MTIDVERRARHTRRRVRATACGALLILVAATAHAQPPPGGGRGGRGGAAPPQRRQDYPVRPPGDPAAIERGKALYGVNCQFCHGADTRGGDGGPSLLRSALVLDDEHGELMAPVVRQRPSRHAEVHADRRADRRHRRVRPHLPRRRLRRIAHQAAEHRRRRREGRRGVLRREMRVVPFGRPAICAASRRKIRRSAAAAADVADARQRRRPRRGRRRCSVPPTTVTVTLPSGEKSRRHARSHRRLRRSR